jgi:diguanylate cyclase (GGDEF)-like protein/PAS domain S-box-containing protein
METANDQSKKSRWVAWLFLLIGFFATGVAAWQEKIHVDEEQSSQFNLRVDEARYNIERQVNAYTEVLWGLRAQFVAHPELSRRTFQQVIQSLSLDKRLPGIQAAGFAQRIAPGALPKFEASLRRELIGNNLGYPVPVPGSRTESQESFLVQYIEPIEKNRRGAWFDQATEQKRRVAIHQARDTGQWAASGRVSLFVDPGNVSGIVLFMPIYRGGAVPTGLEERREKFYGVVFMGIRVDEMLRSVLGAGLLDDLHIDIHNMDVVSDAPYELDDYNLIFDSGKEKEGNARHADSDPSPLQSRLTFSLGGSTWQLNASTLPAFTRHAGNWLPSLVAFAGMVLSMMVFFFMRMLDLSRRASDTRAREVELSLHAKEKQLAGLTASIDEVLWRFSLPDGKLIYVSQAVERMYGWPAEDFYANPRLWLRCVHPADRTHLLALSKSIVEAGKKTLQYRITRPDGEVRWIRFEAHFIPGATPEEMYLDGIGTDITQQHRLEESLRRSNQALRAIHDCEKVLDNAEDENAMLQGICDVVVTAGYRMAWAGVVSSDGSGSIVPNGIAGEHQGYLACIQASLAAGERDRLSTIGAALNTHQPIVANRLDSDPRLARWRVEALRRGFSSKIALPLFDDQETIGVFNVYAIEQDAFDKDEVELLMGLARSVTVAMQSLRHRSGRQKAEAALHLRNRAIEASHNGMLILQCKELPTITSVNSALVKLVGRQPADLLDKSLAELGECGFDAAGWEQLTQLVHARCEDSLTITLAEPGGGERWFDVCVVMVANESGSTDYVAIEFRDITENMHYQEQIEHQSNYDSLTELPNRNLLMDRLQQSLRHTQRAGDALFVLWLNLDRFQAINDSLGMQATEQILRIVAGRLSGLSKECQAVARVERDEFVLLANAEVSHAAIVSLVGRVQALFLEPIQTAGQDVTVTACIGIAAAPDDGTDAETLLRNASIAMYRAKEAGPGSFCFYAEDMNARAIPRLRLEAGLRKAIERNELFLVYQPKIDLSTGRMTGSEALIRWRHPELGLVSPVDFIPVAEECGLILPIGQWVLETACAQIRQWLDEGLDCQTIAVNVSPVQFFRSDVVGQIKELLSKYRLEPQCFMVEITESTLMRDTERAVVMMQQLKNIGIKLAIDDFGTGYSSLNALKRFPIDYLKIDRSFVTDLTIHASDAAIAAAIISLAHSLNLRVIAEGVETEEQLLYLRERHCEEVQGYYFSRPVEAQQLAGMIREDRGIDLLRESARLAP